MAKPRPISKPQPEEPLSKHEVMEMFLDIWQGTDSQLGLLRAIVAVLTPSQLVMAKEWIEERLEGLKR